MNKCFFCGGDKDVLINKNLKDISNINGKVTDQEPCSQCKEYMQRGIIIIPADTSKTEDNSNPYRIGSFLVVKEDMVKEIFEDVDHILKARAMFLDIEALLHLGPLMVAKSGLRKYMEEIGSDEKTTEMYNSFMERFGDEVLENEGEVNNM